MRQAWVFVLAGLAPALLGGCSADLAFDKQAAIGCSAALPACPVSWRCATTIGLCVQGDSPEPPAVLSVAATYVTTLEVVFNHAMHLPSLGAVSSYTITPALAVLDARAAADGLTVTLVTAEQAGGRAYALAVSGPLDAFGTVLAPAAPTPFVGFGPVADTSPPSLVKPASPSYLVAGSVELEWTARFGAHRYVVDIARDAAFSLAALPAALTIVAPETRVTVTLPRGETYFWRVRADTTDEGVFATGNFALLDDALYVGCPAPGDCLATPQIAEGGRATPMRSVQQAIDQATLLGLSEVRIAARQEGAAYHESLVLVGGGLTLEGGYSADFASRDSALYPTALESSGTTLLLAAIRAPCALRGLSLASTEGAALVIGDATDALTIEQCRLESRATGDLASALRLGDSPAPGPLVRDNVITVASSPAAAIGVLVASGHAQLVANHVSLEAQSGATMTGYGIFVTGEASATIRGNDIRMAGAAENTAVLVRQADATIDGNVIVVGPGATTAMGVDVGQDGSATITANRIHVHGACWASRGLSAGGSSGYGQAKSFVAANNVVLVTGGPYCLGIDTVPSAGTARSVELAHNTVLVSALDTGGPGAAAIGLGRGGDEVCNNNIFACAGAVPGYGVRLWDTLATGSFQHNLVAGCAVLYEDHGATATSAAELNGLDGTSGTACETTRFDGNLASSLSVEQLFVDADGPTNDFADSAANDLHLLLATDPDGVATGGRDTGAHDCGSCTLPVTCGEVTLDADGRPRTPPPSLGAFEKDT
jgi:hypothetical protein